VFALFENGRRRGRRVRGPPDTRASAIVRVGKAFLDVDVIAGTAPDVTRAVAVYELLLPIS
jgi:hypothetical protein